MNKNLNEQEPAIVEKTSPGLHIYITSDCFGCEGVGQVKSEIAERFPFLVIEIVNLDDPNAVKPDNVFAVPTYVLNGEVISLGNLYLDQLSAIISKALSNNRYTERIL
ncbi:MAG: thioredoxin family protein [Acidobacteriota bacterium]